MFCLQSAIQSLLPCGFPRLLFVKGSRHRLPIELRELIAARLSLNVCWYEIHFGHPILFSSGKLLVESALL